MSKEHAEHVGKLLIMSGRFLDYEPELAYQYAQEALRRASRIDVVREAAGIAAYVTERYSEALRELRTVRRLTGSSEHLPLMADAERGLGRPEKALELVNSPEAETLTKLQKIELAMVAAGARADLGQFDAALATLDRLPRLEGDTALRVLIARATVLQAAGRDEEAKELLSDFDANDLDRAAGNIPDEVTVFDLLEDADDDEPGGDDDERAADDEAADEFSNADKREDAAERNGIGERNDDDEHPATAEDTAEEIVRLDAAEAVASEAQEANEYDAHGEPLTNFGSNPYDEITDYGEVISNDFENPNEEGED
ncbi:MAG: hypothetical protein FWG25_00860 [Promicromonosporaceae bacterium]|nr:hypothetical protein [Promicromonosporaceae bacterium]